MNDQSAPFKFLDAYQQKDGDVFFGREQETNDLYDALSGVKHLLVYGPSGAGKTSLVECGLRNQFSEADWLALTIRRGTNITASVFGHINEALEEKINLDNQTQLPKDVQIGFEKAIEKLFEECFQPVYLLFDQFEELLLLGSESEKNDFFKRLNNLIRYKVPCRVMLIMREEFIGYLSEFEHLCPSIFQHRFRLEKMGRANVREVLFKMLEAPHYRAYFQVEDSVQLAESILAKLPDKRREIELTHVQVFLSELWERAKKESTTDSLPTLHKGLIKSKDNLEVVLDNFLKKQLYELDNLYGRNISMEVLAAMISERHTKLQLSQTDLENDLNDKGVILKEPLSDLLKDLEKRRIIRKLRSDNKTQYEISHDLLALIVGHNLTEEMKLREKAREIYGVYEDRKGYFSQDDLDYLRPYQQYLAYPSQLGKRISESEEYIQNEKKRELEEANARAEKEAMLRSEAEAQRQKAEISRKRSKQRAILAVVVAIFAIVAAIFAFFKQIEVEKANEIAFKRTIEKFFTEGNANMKAGQFDKAIDQYKLLLTLDSTQKASIKTEQFNEPIAQYEALFTLDSTLKAAHDSIHIAKIKAEEYTRFDSLITKGDKELGDKNLTKALDYFYEAQVFDVDNNRRNNLDNKINHCKNELRPRLNDLLYAARRFYEANYCDKALTEINLAKTYLQYIEIKQEQLDEIEHIEQCKSG